MILVTGGAGFIGSAVSRRLIMDTEDEILIFDKLTYAGNLDSIAPIINNARLTFRQADICDRRAVTAAGAFGGAVLLRLFDVQYFRAAAEARDRA